MGCDCEHLDLAKAVVDFYSHIPCGMWLLAFHSLRLANLHFYSHIPCGMWPIASVILIFAPIHFYSHIPCGMWLKPDTVALDSLHFYSHIPCGMWRNSYWILFAYIPISTHTSRVGCDRLVCLSSQPSIISTHTSRVGCDQRLSNWMLWQLAFLLTHPVWDVTADSATWACNSRFLLTHPVWDVT